MSKLIAGTRKSQLARVQTTMVGEFLKREFPGLEIEEILIMTKGDKILDAPLAKIGDKGLFTREIEQQLLDGSIDYAVHSFKDLPTELPEGLAIGAVLEREKPCDVLVAPAGTTIDSLPAGSRVGTSSLRRIAQLMNRRSDLTAIDIRGNLNTRLAKYESGEYDALLLAAAGMIRLGFQDKFSSTLEEGWYHAVSQGAIAVEVREDDKETMAFIEKLNHEPTRKATAAERAFLRKLEGGCQVPVGVRTTIENGTLTLYGMVAGLNGKPFIEGKISGSQENAAALGTELAEELISRGADEVLKSIRSGN